MRCAYAVALLAALTAACSMRAAAIPLGDGGAMDAAVAPTDAAHPLDMGPRPLTPLMPRLLAPLTTSRVTRWTPTLSVVASTDVQVRIELQVCADRGCGTVHERIDATTGTARPAAPLPPGVWFWRARAVRDGAMPSLWSTTWWFSVPHLDGVADTARGGALDANGDGLADVAELTAPDGMVELHVRYGRQGAAPAAAPDLVAPRPTHPFAATFGPEMVSADFDGNGLTDLAVAGTTNVESGVLHSGGAVYVFAGERFGFETAPILALTAPPDETGNYVDQLFAVGDANRDGYADLVVREVRATAPIARLHLFLGGPGWLARTPASSLDLEGNELVYAGDLDGDGFAELVTTADRGDLLVVSIKGALDPSDVTRIAPPAGALWEGYVAPAGDFDGDGRDDLVAAVHADASAFRSYVLFGHAGPLTFADAEPLTAATNAGAIAIGDPDGNGCGDLLLLDVRARTATVLDGCTGLLGTWPAPGELAGPFGTFQFARFGGYADLDGDTRDDLVFVAGGEDMLYRSPLPLTRPTAPFGVEYVTAAYVGY